MIGAGLYSAGYFKPQPTDPVTVTPDTGGGDVTAALLPEPDPTIPTEQDTAPEEAAETPQADAGPTTESAAEEGIADPEPASRRMVALCRNWLSH